MSARYVSGEKGYRWWLDPKDCSHDNGNVCQTCDHDRYYAKTYQSVPWSEVDPGDASHWSDGTPVDPAELAANHYD